MSGWTRLGRVELPPLGPMANSHAMLPTPLVLDDRIRVYFAACDVEMRGRVYWADLSRDDPRRVIDVSPGPALDLGKGDAFDVDGVNPSQVVQRDGAVWLYYIGWRRGPAEAPYTLFVGLAKSEDGGRRFYRVQADPILKPVPGEELFRTASHVFRWGEGWAMFYIGGGAFFTAASGKRLPTYGLRCATSDDGFNWDEPGAIALSPRADRGEIGFGRPVLWRDDGRVVLLLSVRSEAGYRLVSVSRLPPGDDDISELLEHTDDAWEAEMTCFGAPCTAGGNEYLFYNGNGFGRTGFGVAQRPATIAPQDGLDRLVGSVLAGAPSLRHTAG